METMRKNARSNMITAGLLKDTATLLQPIYTSDGRGGTTVAFVPFGVVWCSAIPSRDTRALEEAAIAYNQSINFTIRVQNVSLTNDWKIEFNGKTYDIHSISDIDNRYQYWEIFAYTNDL
jgi:SPP1 family predicted phage head-tail adaptor